MTAAKPRGSQPSARRRRPSAAERAAARRRRRLRTITWLVVAVLVVGGVVGFAGARSQSNARAVRALGVQTFANQGQQHLQQGPDYSGYNSTPPTSGPHSPHGGVLWDLQRADPQHRAGP